MLNWNRLNRGITIVPLFKACNINKKLEEGEIHEALRCQCEFNESFTSALINTLMRTWAGGLRSLYMTGNKILEFFFFFCDARILRFAIMRLDSSSLARLLIIPAQMLHSWRSGMLRMSIGSQHDPSDQPWRTGHTSLPKESAAHLHLVTFATVLSPSLALSSDISPVPSLSSCQSTATCPNCSTTGSESLSPSRLFHMQSLHSILKFNTTATVFVCSGSRHGWANDSFHFFVFIKLSKTPVSTHHVSARWTPSFKIEIRFLVYYFNYFSGIYILNRRKYLL